MIQDELIYRIRERFGFEPTMEQQRALEVRRLVANDVDEILNVGILVYFSKCPRYYILQLTVDSFQNLRFKG